MVSRRHKLAAAAAVLAGGMSLALLFRRSDDEAATAVAGDPMTPVSPLLSDPFAGQFSPAASVPASSASLMMDVPGEIPPTPPALSEPSGQPDTGTPLLAGDGPTGGPVEAEITGDNARPVYVPDQWEADRAESPAQRTHVVHDGDTLERLAERYLSDGSRAMEIFDLNRDVLENPHVLRIGTELRIPGIAHADD